MIHRSFESPEAEADGIAAAIAERLRAGHAASEIAVLVRTNAQADPILRSLSLQGTPWSFSGASGLYGRPEVRELLSFLRCAANPDSTVDLYGLVSAPPYGLGGGDLTAILEYARRRHRSLWAVLRELDEQPRLVRLSEETLRRLRRVVRELGAALAEVHARPAGEILYAHLKGSGRLATLIAAPHGEDSLRNIARFFEVVRREASLLREDRVPFLVPHLDSLIRSGDDPASAEPDWPAEAVSVMTVHRAKGLEFRVVFVAGLSEGRFPTRGRRGGLELPVALLPQPAADDEEVRIAEERRLMFVAMTRARDELILSHPLKTSGGRATRPSAFLAEALDLPPALRASTGLAGQPLELIERCVAPPRAPDAAPGPAAPTSATTESPPDRALTLSFSQLDDYLTCPARYRLRHVIGLTVPPHHALSYGSALHQAVAAFHASQRRGRPFTEEELLDVFTTHWTGEGFLSRQHEEARYAAGQATLRRFRGRELASGEVPVGVEQEFQVTLGTDRVRGRFDRVDRATDGVVITDYKSSDVPDQAVADRKARESLQLSIYALAHEAASGTPPVRVQLRFLDSDTVGAAPVTASRLERARKTLSSAAAGIRTGEFTAKPDLVACGYCPFRDICPASAA